MRHTQWETNVKHLYASRVKTLDDNEGDRSAIRGKAWSSDVPFSLEAVYSNHDCRNIISWWRKRKLQDKTLSLDFQEDERGPWAYMR